MTGKSSDCRDKSGKNQTLAVATPASSIMLVQEDLLLSTRHQILMENHESLKQDYESREKRLKLLEEMNQTMKLHHQNQTKELEATKLRLLKDLERERSEKYEYMKMVEEMKRMESESNATINELRIKNEELLIEIEKEEEERNKKENKYDDLAKRIGEMEEECLHLKSLYDAKNHIDQGRNDEVILVGENKTVNTVADAIVISDESDAEYNNPLRESNGADSSQVNHLSSKIKFPSWSLSSPSSSSDEYFGPPPVKRYRDDYNNKF